MSAQEPLGAHAPLQRLAASVEAIECEPIGLDSAAASEALSNLAEALDLRSGPADVSSQELRTDARALASGAAAPTGHVRDGLAAALQALLAGPEPLQRRLEYRNSVAALGRFLGDVASNDAASCQSARDALRAATNAVFLALDGEPPFDVQDIAHPEIARLSSMSAGIEPARAAVLALGEARWAHAREPAAQALRSFAAMLNASNCAQRLTRTGSDVLLQAERLMLGDSLSFGQTQWIKSGLLAALDGLEQLAQGAASARSGSTRTPPAASPWLAAARKAVANIDAKDLLAFQRTAIQDAFRATLDAFTFTAQYQVSCQQ